MSNVFDKARQEVYGTETVWDKLGLADKTAATPKPSVQDESGVLGSAAQAVTEPSPQPLGGQLADIGEGTGRTNIWDVVGDIVKGTSETAETVSAVMRRSPEDTALSRQTKSGYAMRYNPQTQQMEQVKQAGRPEGFVGAEAAGYQLEHMGDIAQQRLGGMFQMLGAKDNVPSTEQTWEDAKKLMLDPNAPTLDRIVAGMKTTDTARFMQEGLDALDTLRAKALENVTFETKGKLGEEPVISLREVLQDLGLNLQKAGKKAYEEGLPEKLDMMDEILMAAAGSAADYFTGAGVLKAANLYSAGTITGAFAAGTGFQIYGDTLEKTGDEKLAFANMLFGGVIEGVSELPAMKALGKIGDAETFLKGVKAYLGREIPGELFAELNQLAGDIVYSEEGQKRTIQENFNAWLEQAPHVAAVTTGATLLGGGAVSGAVGAGQRAYNNYQNWKFAQQQEAFFAKANRQVSTANEINEVRTRMAEKAKVQMEASMLQYAEELLKNSPTIADAEKQLTELAGKLQAFTGTDEFAQLMADTTLRGNIFHTTASTQNINRLTLFAQDGTSIPATERPDVPGTFFGTDEVMSAHGQQLTIEKSILATSTELLKVLQGQEAPAEVISKVQDNITLARQRLEILNITKAYTDFLRTDGLALVEKLRKTFAPTMKIILNDGTHTLNEASGVGGITFGSMSIMEDGTLMLMANPAGFLENAQTDAEGNVVKIKPNAMIETILHEFGHGLAYHWLDRSSIAAQEAVKKAYDAYRQKAWEVFKNPNASEIELERLGRGYSTLKQFRQMQFIAKDVTAQQVVEAYKRTGHRGAPSALPRFHPDNLAGTYFNYVFSFDEWFAHEMERAFLGDSKVNALARTVLTKNARILQSMHEKAKNTYAPSETFSAYLHYMQAKASEDVENAMKRILQTDTQNIVKAHQATNDGLMNVVNYVRRKPGEFSLDEVVDPKASLDKFNGFMATVATLTQIAQENPHIPELQRYMQAVEAWWGEKSLWIAKGVETVEAWQNLGKDMADRVAKFALAVTLESDRLGRQLNLKELMEINKQKKHQLSDDAFAIWEQVDQDFRDALGYDPENPTALYKALINDIKRIHARSPEVAMEALKNLDKDMQELANKNFFPLSRFGHLGVVVKALEPTTIDGVYYETGETVLFETFEDEQKQIESLRTYKKQWENKPVQVMPRKLTDDHYAFSNLPPSLLKALQSQLDLSATQQEALEDVLLKHTSASRFKKHLLERAGTPGFSSDAMRGYASYMANFANAVARMEYAPIMQEQITALGNTVNTISAQDIDAAEVAKQTAKRQDMVTYLNEHFQYVMNPGNEWANLRGMAFLFYMGLMPASALINLTQVPMVAWPYLSQREELGGNTYSTGTVAMTQITKAMKDVMSIYKGKLARFTKGENEMFATLVQRGILDESQAQELAGFAEGSNLQRMLPDGWGFGLAKTTAAGRVIRRANYAGAFLFHQAEKFNRKVVALAAYRMALKQGLSDQQAVDEAHLAVRETQFEYARWNRPLLMRGPVKSNMFMFKMYLENMLYFMGKGTGGRRTILLFLLMAGLSGLPGAKDAMALFDFVVNLWNKHFGDKGARMAVDEELRSLALGLGMNPNLVMNGLSSQYGAGPLHLLEYAGIPIPKLDTSSRMSMGSVIPGLQPLLSLDQGGPGETIGEVTSDVSGAVAAIPIGIYKALSSDNPDTWKNLEKAMPAAAKYWSQMLRMGTRGKETRYDGSTLQEFNLSNPQDLTQLAIHGMGIPATKLTEAKHEDWAQQKAATFYKTRKSIILSQFAYATLAKDREGKADALKAVKDYNSSVPHGGLRILSKDIKASIQTLARKRTRNELGVAQTRRGAGLHQEVQELYPIIEEPTR